MNFQIASVSFLNALPLVEWFDTPDGAGHTVLDAIPSRLAEILAQGKAHAGLLPVAESLRAGSDGILMGTGIACQGAVDSVKLYCRGVPGDLTTIRADRGSRSSVALLKILLKEMYSSSPVFSEIKPTSKGHLMPQEGLLVIGDRCLEMEKRLGNKGPEDADLVGWDLGQLWWDLTGLPFVFATWALAPGFVAKHGTCQVENLKQVLESARDFGLNNIPDLARREADLGRLGRGGDASAEAIDYYFSKSLCYILDDREFQGMKRFHELGVGHGLFPDLPFPTLW
jgi:chorismate dehydratase